MKKNMRKVAALGLCVALGATMLTACGGSKGKSASGGKTELNFGIWDENQRPAMEKMVKAYEKENSDVKINIQLTPYKGGEYWTKLEAAEDFAIWLGSKEAQEIQGKTGVVISARTDAQKCFAEANSQYNLAAYTNHADEAYPLPVCAKAAELYDLEATELQKAYNGEKSLSDVCKGLTKQADKLLQE